MAKEFSKSFYKSSAWKSCREAYIALRKSLDGGLCEVCGEEVGYIVHHIEPLTPENIDNPDITLCFNNLRYDCKECHDKEEVHAFIKRKALLCRFDTDGQPLPLPPCLRF